MIYIILHLSIFKKVHIHPQNAKKKEININREYMLEIFRMGND